MASKTNSGFTIIETMLFLSVSGVLMASVMIGVGSVVTQQRYRDSVVSLKSYVQDQYSQVVNTVNGRSGDESCSTGGVVTLDAPNPSHPGTSECLLVGRYMTIDASGQNISAGNVIAYPKTPQSQQASDIADLRANYTLSYAPVERETYPVAWGARIVQEAAINSAKPFSILIARSPRSGGVMTFTSASLSSPQDLITLANNSTPLHLCVGGDRGILGGVLQEVRIDGYAANQGAVQVPLESESVCAE